MQQKEKNERASYLVKFFEELTPNTPIHLSIPSEVKQDYVPSGKIATMTIPILLVSGLVGMALGYGVSWLISSGSYWIFEAFDKAGFCLNIIYLPAGILYLLAPLAIPWGGGMAIAGGGALSSCRSPKVGLFVGILIGLASAAVAIYVSYSLFDELPYILSVLDGMAMGVSTFLTMIGLGLFYWLTQVADHYVWFGILTVLSVLLSASMGREAGTGPFCEQAMKFLKDHVVRNFQVNEIPRLLIGILNRDEKYLTDLKQVGKDVANRLDVTLWTLDDHQTNLIEVKAYYEKIEYGKKGEKKSNESRLVLSEALDKSELEKVAGLLNVNLGKLKE